jgi:hypothetical protein
MPNVIEEAKSGRATCRTCKQKIDKGALRFGEETVNQFDTEGGTTFMWHHLVCAARKKGALVKPLLETYTGDIPNRAEIDAALAAAPQAAAAPPANFPYVEKAPTGRSKCLLCEEAIAKGEWRVAVEREVDTGAFMRAGPGYLHPGCAIEQTGDDELLDKIKANMPTLSEADAAQLGELMAAGDEGD